MEFLLVSVCLCKSIDVCLCMCDLFLPAEGITKIVCKRAKDYVISHNFKMYVTEITKFFDNCIIMHYNEL